ncbi:uncharacterized protein LOC121491656 isoform X2 [Vulpes lagopus]|uniref:uncharacterized protein LOC121491656 isoform X2 n=1 Tax=Vulpes lagopus TaxID=494514 RepID=UPI001BCA3E76|nr:uncharacterized protein LOC121491656 isoform X2 [Vulpes lagopus]
MDGMIGAGPLEAKDSKMEKNTQWKESNLHQMFVNVKMEQMMSSVNVQNSAIASEEGRQPLPRSLLSEVTKLHLSHPSGWKPKARSPMSPAAAGGGDDVLKVEENVRRRKLPASAWDIRRGLAQALVMKPEAKQCVQSMDTDADTRLPGFKSLLSHLLCDLGLLQPWLLALTAASGSLLCRVEG